MLFVVLCGLLAGCAASPPFQLPLPSSGKVTIYAFRTASIVGGANSDIVAVNGRFIGRLNSGTYVVHVAPPGQFKVARKAGSILGSGQDVGWGLGGLVGAIDGFVEVASFRGTESQIYFVRFPHGELVPNDKALPMMDGLEDVTPHEP
jgi:hypothetical protein